MTGVVGCNFLGLDSALIIAYCWDLIQSLLRKGRGDVSTLICRVWAGLQQGRRLTALMPWQKRWLLSRGGLSEANDLLFLVILLVG